MTNIQFVTALASVVSFAGLWVLLFKFYRDYRVDQFRQEMFALRDELFDFASEGQVSYEHPAYWLLRRTMNGFVRFGHRVRLMQGIVFWVLGGHRLPEPQNGFQIRWSTALQDVGDDDRQRLETYRKRMHELVVKHLILYSPLLVVSLVGLFVVWVFSAWCLDQALSRLHKPLDDLDDAAVAYGR